MLRTDRLNEKLQELLELLFATKNTVNDTKDSQNYSQKFSVFDKILNWLESFLLSLF